MVKEALMYEKWCNTPPFQPFVSRFADSYQECQVSWNPYCIKKDALFYQFRTDDNEEAEVGLVPDACLNILISLDASDPYAVFYGALLHSEELKLKPGTTYFGFKPYSNLGIKSTVVSPHELVNTSAEFAYAFQNTESLITNLSEAADFNSRVRAFTQFAARNIINDDYLPTFTDYLAVMICTSYGNIVLNNAYHEIGYSERYCCEEFKKCYGISPKQYGSIIRFQNTLKLLVAGSRNDLSTLAVDGGYFDQSHLARNFKRYTDTSPDRYLKKYQAIHR